MRLSLLHITIGMIWLIVGILPLSMLAQCNFSSDFPVDDFSTTSASISVEDALNNDLSNTGQGVCGVFIEFEHTHIGDLLIELISPSGQSVSLIGSVVNSGNTSATNWNLFFTSCASPASPDIGFSPTWNNNQSWGILGNYTGTYYPYLGCLEDFNTGPVNGLWSLNIIDANLFDVGTILNFSIVFCDLNGINCVDCFELDASSDINSDTLNCYKKELDLQFSTEFLFDSLRWEGPNDFTSSELQPSISVPGNYMVNAYYGDLCVIEKSVAINIDTIIPQVITADGYFDCYNPSDTLDLSDADSTNSYAWTGPESFVSDKKNPVIFFGGNYFVTVTGQNGCSTESNLNIEANTTNPTLSTENFVLPCNTDSIIVFADIQNPNVSVIWEGPNDFYSTLVEPMVFDTGTYYIHVFTDFNGCSSNDSLSVIQSIDVPQFDIQSVGALNCVADSMIIIAKNIDDDLSFYWQFEGGQSSIEDTIVVYNASMYGLFVTGTNLCVDSQFIEVKLDTIRPEVEISPVGYIKCARQDMMLSSEGSSVGDTYVLNWSTNIGEIQGSINALDIDITGAGIYYLEIIDTINHCTLIDSIDIVALENNMHDLTAIIENPSCTEVNNGTIQATEVLGGTPPFNYSLNEGTYGPSSFFEGLGEGDYILSVEDQDGCKLFTTAVLKSETDFIVDLGLDMEVNFGDDIMVVANISIEDDEIDSILWTPDELTNCTDCSLLDLKIENSQQIIVSVVDTAGCVVSDSLFINVNASENIFVPNIFSPNEDGQNDYFFVQAGGGIELVNEMIVFDKRAIPYFHQINISANVQEEGWDGRWEGKKANPGVYIYYIKVLLRNGKTVSLSGDLTLIR